MFRRRDEGQIHYCEAPNGATWNSDIVSALDRGEIRGPQCHDRRRCFDGLLSVRKERCVETDVTLGTP